ncbi:chloride channel protein [uncultured Polaribacter sp.]|uniref:chloride channel protein n=1 Tax=uncultured Polaribacter sp. TaxID=174711 RepID=UPI002634258F|nr:chloride channel protein [uncultured Polaribacter sp.]
MPSTKNIFKKILIWRYKSISERQFLFILSILVGFLAGFGTVILKNLTHAIQLLLSIDFLTNYKSSLYFIFPIIGLFIVAIIKKKWLKKHIGHGISTTLYAISKKKGIIPKYNIFASLITAPLTAGFGGSVGLQGPAVSAGTALASYTSQLFHMSTKTRMLLIGCATAGAMSSMFQAPIAGIVFALEVFSLDIAFVSLVPLLLASVSAIITSYFFLGNDVLLGFELANKFKISEIFFYAILGIFTGIVSIYFSVVYFAIRKFFYQFEKRFTRFLIGSIVIGFILFLMPALYGEGYGLINNLLEGNHLAAIGDMPFNFDKNNIWLIILFLLLITIFKAIAMSTTFAAGGVGGIFIPTLVMGSAVGNAFAKIINNIGLGFHVSETNFTLIGMTGLMAGVLHAPLTAIFLIAEITGGYDLFVPLMLVAAISFAFTKYFVSNSIYTYKLAQRGELITHNKDKNVMMMMQIDELIETNFKTIQPDMFLGDVLKNAVAKSSRNIFPVVDSKNQFLGIVLLDDLRPVMFDTVLYKSTTIETFMKASPETIAINDNVEKVMQKFKTSKAWNLPVVKDGVYVGFISKSKLLTAYRNKLVEVTN